MRWTPLQTPILETSGQLRLACTKPRMLMNPGVRWLSSSCTEVPDHLKCVQEIHHSTLLSTTWASAPLPSRMHLLVWTHSARKFLIQKLSDCNVAPTHISHTTNQREQNCSVNNVCTGVANGICAHESVMLVFISRVAKQLRWTNNCARHDYHLPTI